MQSYMADIDNPWNLFISNGYVEKTESKYYGEKSTENFLSSSLPVSFSRSRYIVNCDICKALVIKKRFKQHYEDRHIPDSSLDLKIPFEKTVTAENKSTKVKNIRVNRKKRKNYQDHIKYPQMYFEEERSKRTKIKTMNKRPYSKSVLDGSSYFPKTKSMKLEDENCESEVNSYLVADEGFMSFSSTKMILEDSLLCASKSSFDQYSVIDGVCCSNESFSRTLSESSTPPSLSLGTLQTLSPPASLAILNEPSSVAKEHYSLLSNDANVERSAVCCKYQINSLPWENTQSKSEEYQGYFTTNCGKFVTTLAGEGEDGEVERAVQSITNICDGFLSVENHRQSKSDMLNPDDSSMIDSFIDEVIGAVTIRSSSPSVITNVQPTTITDLSSHIQPQGNRNNGLITSDYDERFDALINSTLKEFITQSPQNINSSHLQRDPRNKPTDYFDPLKHCGVLSVNGGYCHRSLLCKLHSMPQKRQVQRPENITSLIKEIRDSNKIKRLQKKEVQSSYNAFTPCNSSSKTSGDSLTYNCSSSRSTEEACSFVDNRLSTPDLDMSVLTCLTDTASNQQTTRCHGSPNGPRPLVRSSFNQDTITSSHHRSLMADKSLLWRNRPKSLCSAASSQKFSRMSLSQSRFRKGSDDLYLPQFIQSTDLPIKYNDCILAQQNCSSHDGMSSRSCNEDTHYLSSRTEVTHLDDSRAQNRTQLLSYNSNSVDNHHWSNEYHDVDSSPSSSNNAFVSSTDLNLSTKSLNLSTTNINAISSMSSAILTSATNSTPHSSNDTSSSLGCNTGHLLVDVTNKSINASSSNNTTAIVDDSSTSGSVMYPVRNGNQIMMLMNKNNGVLGQHGNVTSDNYNHNIQSMPLNTFVTLKQNSQQDRIVGSSQIVSISSLELQRLSESIHSSIPGNVNVTTNDCINASNDSSNNAFIYQIQQSQSLNNCIIQSPNINSNILGQPLTVQSSTINGKTQKFIILPDGTISSFTEPANILKTGPQQTQIQYPLFNQLLNYGHNQRNFINNDNIIMTPNKAGLPIELAPQILVPQVINHTNINNHSSSALTFIQPQNPQSSRVTLQNNLLTTQIPVVSSHQKLSLQIQGHNQFQNQIPNTFFISATGNDIPFNQHIFVKSTGELQLDTSSIDSMEYVDGQCNVVSKSMTYMDKVTCMTNGVSSHLLNAPPTVILQQPHVNRESQSKVHGIGCSSSLDIKPVIDDAHLSIQSCNRPQHIVVKNTNNTNHHHQHNANEQFAQSHLKLSNTRQVSSKLTRYIDIVNPPHGTSLAGIHGQTTYKSIPPPLVISQQLFNKSLKSSNETSYQIKQPQTSSQAIQVTQRFESQHTNEHVIVQYMIT